MLVIVTTELPQGEKICFDSRAIDTGRQRVDNLPRDEAAQVLGRRQAGRFIPAGVLDRPSEKLKNVV